MKTKLIYTLVAVAIVTSLLLSGIAFAGGFGSGSGETPPASSNSVRITVGDGTPMTNVAEGDVLHDGEERGASGDSGDGEVSGCDVPSVTIRASGDVRKVRVGLKDGTCDLIVKDITMNDTVLNAARGR